MRDDKPGGLTTAHRRRLIEVGVDPDVLLGLTLQRRTAGLSQAWHEAGNALYIDPAIDVPDHVITSLQLYPSTNSLAVIVVEFDRLQVLVHGADATVFMGPHTYIPSGDLYCGEGSSVVFNGYVKATGKVIADARNGGTIRVEQDQLWADNILIATDDMHRIEDLATGARLNPYGAHIVIDEHVWLGRDVCLTGHVEIGTGCVVGMRSLVRSQKIAPNSSVAGSPARVLREGITWRDEDTP